jgi:TolA-binding protein
LALIHLGRASEAETLLRSLANDAPAPVGDQAALELATIELEGNRPAAALSTLEKALKRFPKSALAPALQFRSAEALLKQNQLPEAEALFLRVAQAAPDDPWADEAMSRAAQTALDRKDPVTARTLAGELVQRFPRSPLRTEARLIEARAVAMQGKYQEAVAIFESIVKASDRATGGPAAPLSPASAQAARYELALAYRALGRSAEAQAILDRLAQGPSSPVAADAQFLIGQAHVEAGRYAEAVPALERYLADHPQGDVADFAVAHLTAAQLGLGRAEEAWKTLGKLTAGFPHSKALPPARLRLAEAALAAHQLERAAEQFRAVAGAVLDQGRPGAGVSNRSDKAPDPALRVRALAGLGRTLQELGKPAEAAAAFAAVLESAPADPLAPEMALAQGRALEASNQAEAALDVYARTAQRFGKSQHGPRAALARARLLAKLDRHTEAARVFEQLVNDPAARDGLARAGTSVDAILAEWGWTLVDAGRLAEADRVFTRLLNEYPDSPHAADARFNLAESANLAGNHAEVIRLLTPLSTVKAGEVKSNSAPTGVKTPTAGPSDATAPGADPRPPSARPGAPSTDSLRRLLPAVLYRLGRTQVELKDWGSAGATFDRLLADYPDNPYRREARFLRAESALRQGDAAMAGSGFAALLEGPPDRQDPEGFSRLVRLKRLQCQVALKRWNEVLQATKALRAELAAGDPAIAELDYARGQALLGLGRVEEARTAFQAVLAARRGGELAAQAQLMYGETYFHQDHFHEALREFLKVDILYKAPHWQAVALLEAGKVYERLEQWADAAETYEGLVARFPRDPIAAEARTRRDVASRRAAPGTGGRGRPQRAAPAAGTTQTPATASGTNG